MTGPAQPLCGAVYTGYIPGGPCILKADHEHDGDGLHQDVHGCRWPTERPPIAAAVAVEGPADDLIDAEYGRALCDALQAARRPGETHLACAKRLVSWFDATRITEAEYEALVGSPPVRYLTEPPPAGSREAQLDVLRFHREMYAEDEDARAQVGVGSPLDRALCNFLRLAETLVEVDDYHGHILEADQLTAICHLAEVIQP